MPMGCETTYPPRRPVRRKRRPPPWISLHHASCENHGQTLRARAFQIDRGRLRYIEHFACAHSLRVHDGAETPSTISLIPASTIAEIRRQGSAGCSAAAPGQRPMPGNCFGACALRTVRCQTGRQRMAPAPDQDGLWLGQRPKPSRSILPVRGEGGRSVFQSTCSGSAREHDTGTRIPPGEVGRASVLCNGDCAVERGPSHCRHHFGQWREAPHACGRRRA